MKKLILLIITLFLFINVKGLEINSKNAILYNMNDKSIIYEKNSQDIVQIASLTKIVTAITVIENTDNLEKEVTITSRMLKGLDGYVKAGFKVGDKLTYMDLLYALMLPSAADAAQALAIDISGSIESFANLMNQKVEEIGVTNSKFDNPIGMDSENNYSTASDLAKILIYSLENETFKTIFNTNYYTINSINKKIEKTLTVTSNLYNLDTSIIDGSKTGFTYGAGMCLASTTSIDRVDYLLITLGADVRTINNLKDTINIYGYYSTNYGYINILSKNELLKTIEVKNSKTKAYDIKSPEDKELYLEKTITKDKLTYKYEGIEKLNRDIKKGDKIGTVTILNNYDILYSFDVYLDVEIKYYNYPLYIGTGFILFLVIFIKVKKFKNS
ncbi:MAG: D-alanyl-D-alanine carboxypeptidase [Bacilli bacterium]|nr:D-alanyl-D-alanine carboxypeptidase [Bacilli bacterium]